MATNAFISGYTVARSDGGSPDVFTDVPEVIEISGFGQSNDLVEATHFGSGGVREYISGLADGQEVSITCNRLPDNAVQSAIINDAGNGTTLTYRITETDGNGNTETYSFAGVHLSWGVGPQVDDRATFMFTLKISGSITRA